jgi:outer membrane lipoprotein-sorting protein
LAVSQARTDGAASKRKQVKSTMVRIGKMIVWLALCPAAFGLAQGAAQAFQSSPSASPAGELDKIIAELNAASAKFKSAQADFSWDQFQAVVQQDDIQTGTIYFKRRKDETVVAAQIKQVDGKDEPKFVVYDAGQIQFYQPMTKQMTILRAGASRGQTESFLTLGFGGSGADLQANWDVTLMGKETLDGVAVAKLDLKPKAQNVQNLFTHVTVWVDPTRGVSLKQIFYEPSGDRRTTTYSNIKYNQPISEDVFHIKTAPGTTIQTR